MFPSSSSLFFTGRAKNFKNMTFHAGILSRMSLTLTEFSPHELLRRPTFEELPYNLWGVTEDTASVYSTRRLLNGFTVTPDKGAGVALPGEYSVMWLRIFASHHAICMNTGITPLSAVNDILPSPKKVKRRALFSRGEASDRYAFHHRFLILPSIKSKNTTVLIRFYRVEY